MPGIGLSLLHVLTNLIIIPTPWKCYHYYLQFIDEEIEVQRNLPTKVKQLVNGRIGFKFKESDFRVSPLRLSLSSFIKSVKWNACLAARHLNLLQDLSTYFGLRLIIRIRQHNRKLLLLVPRDTVLALWPQIMLSVPPCCGSQGHPSRSWFSLSFKLFTGGPATANPLHTVADPSQLPFYLIYINVVITTTTPCHRFQMPGTRVGPVRLVSFA